MKQLIEKNFKCLSKKKKKKKIYSGKKLNFLIFTNSLRRAYHKQRI